MSTSDICNSWCAYTKRPRLLVTRCRAKQQQQDSFPVLAAELLSEVTECTRYKESKLYLAGVLKVLLVLPLDGRDVAAIKQLRALAGWFALFVLLAVLPIPVLVIPVRTAVNGCCLLFDQHLFTFSSRQTVFAVMAYDHGPCEESGGPCGHPSGPYKTVSVSMPSAAGMYIISLQLWQARAHRANPIGVAIHLHAYHTAIPASAGHQRDERMLRSQPDTFYIVYDQYFTKHIRGYKQAVCTVLLNHS